MANEETGANLHKTEFYKIIVKNSREIEIEERKNTK